MYHHHDESKPDKLDRHDDIHINIDRDKEMRSEGISEMIDEGGLGAFNYYDVTKEPSSESKTTSEESSKSKDNNPND